MKLVSSRVSQRSEDAEQNREFRQDNRTLRAQLSRGTGRTLLQPVAHNSARRRTNPPSSSNGTTPSYAQPTKASRLRDVTSTSSKAVIKSPSRKSGSSSQSPKPTSSSDHDPWNPKVPVAGAVTINGKDAVYENGKMKIMTFGFLHPTEAHLNHVAARRAECNQPGLVWNTSGVTWRSPEWVCPPMKKTQGEEHQPATKSHIMSQGTFDDLVRPYYENKAQRVIATRTGLSDNHFTTGLSCSVYIDHDQLCKILTEALGVARQCVWRWYRTHLLQEFKYSSNIDFGRDMITTWNAHMPRNVRKNMEGLIQLRNCVCHFNGRVGVACADEYVANVQDFAVRLLDEEGAQAARAVRDSLGAEAQKTVDEITTLTRLTTFAGDGDREQNEALWCVHHTDTVWDAVNKIYQHGRSIGHGGLDTAAREWASHNRDCHYGRNPPEAEGCTKTTGGSARAVDLVDMVGTTSSEYQELNMRRWETMQWPRGSVEGEAACSGNVLEGMGDQGDERPRSAAGP